MTIHYPRSWKRMSIQNRFGNYFRVRDALCSVDQSIEPKRPIRLLVPPGTLDNSPAF